MVLMATLSKITIGTRGSKLSLAQSGLVVAALKKKHPELTIETKIITTKGDIDQSPIPANAVGKAWFTAEIEAALLKGEIDIAIHSMKDLPPEATDKLVTLTVLERGDARDVLIGKSGASLKQLSSGAIIGTDSVRRKALLLEERPDIVVQSIRGNIDTRLKKMATENYDAIVLAAAGLARAGLTDVPAEFLDSAVFVPAPGQGVLAAQARSDREEILLLLKEVEHGPTVTAAAIEQAFSQAIGGGCKLPIGCYALIEGNTVTIWAMVGELANGRVARKMATGLASEGIHIVKKMAEECIAEGKL
jgi:hydroxymethylbilane synthase